VGNSSPTDNANQKEVRKRPPAIKRCLLSFFFFYNSKTIIFVKNITRRSINYLRSWLAKKMPSEINWWNGFEELEYDIEQMHDSEN
jgi:serine acetyltransferase